MNKSYRDLLDDWGLLVAAVRAGEVDLPVLTDHRATLENHLENVKATRARQLGLQEERRQATRELRQMILVTADKVRCLRSRVKAELGPRDARLRLFGIKPLT